MLQSTCCDFNIIFLLIVTAKYVQLSSVTFEEISVSASFTNVFETCHYLHFYQIQQRQLLNKPV